MRSRLFLVAGFAVGVFALILVADIVNVQPLDAYNTVLDSSGWLPAAKVYSLTSATTDWVYWQQDDLSSRVTCVPPQGWISPGTAVNVTMSPAASMAGALPGTYTDQVTFSFDPRLVGDVNGDGTVDVIDLLTLIPAFGSQVGGPGYDVTSDFDGDGYVDVFDLLYMIGTFGQTYGGTVV